MGEVDKKYHILEKLKSQNLHDICQFNLDGKIVLLRPIDKTDNTASLLLEWRNKEWNWFNTKFIGTLERTKKWIIDIENTPNKILFFVICDGEKIGHFGIHLYNSDENSIVICNVLKGVKNSSPNLMEHALKKLFRWIFLELKISTIYLNVCSDNWKAIRLYEKCGMQTIGTTPLKRIITNDGWEWVKTKLESENSYPERYRNKMKIQMDSS